MIGLRDKNGILIILSGTLVKLCVKQLVKFSPVIYILNENILELLILMMGKSINCFIFTLVTDPLIRSCTIRILRQLLPCGPLFVIVLGPHFPYLLDVMLNLAPYQLEFMKHYRKGKLDSSM